MLVVTAYLILFIAIRALCSLIFPRREWSRQSTEFIWGTGSFLSEAAAQNSFGEEKHSGKSWMTMACPTQYLVCRLLLEKTNNRKAPNNSECYGPAEPPTTCPTRTQRS